MWILYIKLYVIFFIHQIFMVGCSEIYFENQEDRRELMKAVRVHDFGEADQLKVEELPVPEPKAGQVLVKIRAAGLNFVEIYQRKGLYPQPCPFTLGGEFSGIVEAVGSGVTGITEGDRVATASGMGAYAEYALAPSERVAKVPEKISMDLAAAVMLQGLTAHYLGLSTFPLKEGDTALIHAAAGGVGQLLVQIAHQAGARVIGTVSNQEKANLAKNAGADQVILYTEEDFEVEVKRLTSGQGVDVVYDSVGQATFAKSLNCLKARGHLVLFGQASGPVEPLNPQVLNQKGSLYLTRPSLGHYLLTKEEFVWRVGDLFRWIESGELKVRIDKTFPLEDAAAAQSYMEERNTKGKVLLIPA
jgi:NADPH:quinone reductase